MHTDVTSRSLYIRNIADMEYSDGTYDSADWMMKEL